MSTFFMYCISHEKNPIYEINPTPMLKGLKLEGYKPKSKTKHASHLKTQYSTYGTIAKFCPYFK